MSNCIRCGGSFLTRMKLKLSDGYICRKCFNELGFDKSYYMISNVYSYEDIKDGFDAYYLKQSEKRAKEYYFSESRKLGIAPEQFRQLEDAGPTEMEIKIFSTIAAILRDDGRDPDAIDIGLGENGSLRLMLNGEVFIRYKADGPVKWITFVNESDEKIRISGAGRMNSYASRIVQSYDSADF